MIAAIHIEIDVLFFLILCFIAWQSARNVSQQMSRVLFRYSVYGVMFALFLDMVWMLIDGRMFPGAVPLNRIINAVFLACGVVLGCIWYLYVLESLGYQLTTPVYTAVLLPGVFMTLMNLVSIRTEWIFAIEEGNVYVRGSLFWLQTVFALGMLFASLIHLVIRFLLGDHSPTVKSLLMFYIIPVIGTLLTLPYTGMPGTWTCAAASIMLFHMYDQDQEITRDSLTGLNNRKALNKAFSDYARQAAPQTPLYMFAMDLDHFKTVNDTYGHPEGDRALIAAAGLFLEAVEGTRSIVARIGGDEFVVLGFFQGEEAAQDLKKRILSAFKRYNRASKHPYSLQVSIGYCAFKPDQSLEQLLTAADAELYRVKNNQEYI